MNLKNFSPKAITLLLVITLAASNGCASSNKNYTGQQKQQLETEVVEGSYGNVFNATRTVFLNSGLALQEINKESGFIRASLNIKGKRSKARYLLLVFGLLGLLLIFTIGKAPDHEVNITATLNDLKNNSVEVRLQSPLLEEQSSEYGVALKRIFAEIKKQTMILEAAGRQ